MIISYRFSCWVLNQFFVFFFCFRSWDLFACSIRIEWGGDAKREDVDEPLLRDSVGGGPENQGVGPCQGGRGGEHGPVAMRRYDQDGARDGGWSGNPRRVPERPISALCREALEGPCGCGEARTSHSRQTGWFRGCVLVYMAVSALFRKYLHSVSVWGLFGSGSMVWSSMV